MNPVAGVATGRARRRPPVLVAVLALVAALATSAGASWSTASAAEPATPTVVAPAGPLVLGTQIEVGGAGWEPRSAVKVEICGNGATNGSNDCNQPASTIFGVWDDGTLHAPLTVASPPRPCPCVIKVWTITSAVSVTTPITIEGLADAPIVVEGPTADSEPSLKVVATDVEDDGGWASWFGAAAPKVLVVRVQNTGTTPVVDSLLQAGWGTGEETDHVITSPDVGEAIAAGEEHTFRAPFDVDALTFGSVDIRGSVGVVANRADLSTTTSSFPWGLVAVALVLSQVLVFGGRAWQRRRARERLEPTDDEATPAADDRALPTFDLDAGFGDFVAAVLAHAADEDAIDPRLLDAVADAGAQVDDATRNAALASAYRSLKATGGDRDHYLALVDAIDRCEAPGPTLSADDGDRGSDGLDGSDRPDGPDGPDGSGDERALSDLVDAFHGPDGAGRGDEGDSTLVH